jgi:hypothetical protein
MNKRAKNVPDPYVRGRGSLVRCVISGAIATCTRLPPPHAGVHTSARRPDHLSLSAGVATNGTPAAESAWTNRKAMPAMTHCGFFGCR